MEGEGVSGLGSEMEGVVGLDLERELGGEERTRIETEGEGVLGLGLERE